MYTKTKSHQKKVVVKLDSNLKEQTQVYEEDFLNTHQNFLYRRAIYGITIYTVTQVEKMSKDKKSKIIANHARCQYVLNIWKQQMVNRITNSLFERYFPKTGAFKLFCIEHRDDTDPDFVNNISFKDLRITKKQIVDKLIEGGVLPEDFYQLKKDTYEGTIPDKRADHAHSKL